MTRDKRNDVIRNDLVNDDVTHDGTDKRELQGARQHDGEMPEAAHTAPTHDPVADPVKGRIYPVGSFTELQATAHIHLNRRLLVPQYVADAELEAHAYDPMKRRAMIKRPGETKGEAEQQDAGDEAVSPEKEAAADRSGSAADKEDASAQTASGEGQPQSQLSATDEDRGGAKRRGTKRPRRDQESGTLAEILATYPSRERWRVIREEAIKALGNTEATADSDMRGRNKAFFKKLEPMGEYRRVGKLPRPQALDTLRQSHPHFGVVIDFVSDRLALAARSRKPVRIPPILLGGPPGIGKTHFCSALAKVLSVPCRRHQMDQAESSSALLGSEKTWSNTRVGLVFEEVVLGEYANPMIILDELDKAHRRNHHSSAAAVLHTLLEPVTAGAVRDLSADIEFDASLVTWVATCNYPWQIEPTLLSRMKCFWIDMPDASQALMMVKSVAAQAIKDAAVPGFQVPGREILVEIAHYSARKQYQIIGEAVARCVRESRKQMDVADIAKWVVRDGEEGVPGVVLH